MPVTRITVSTAMRARDVSRPQAEQLAAAAEREEAVHRPAQQPTAAAPAPRPETSAPETSAPDKAQIPVPAPPPRRRRRRGR